MAVMAHDISIPSRPGQAWQVPVPSGMLAGETVGRGLPLLFLHGWTLDRRAWTPQVDALRDQVQSILIDRRGCGQSTASPSLGDEPDDLVAVLEQRSIDEAVIVAMSQGVRIALAFAARHPGRVRALVLQGPPLLFPTASGIAPDAAAVSGLHALARESRWTALGDALRRDPLFFLPGGEGEELRDLMLNAYRARDLLSAGRPLHLSSDEVASIRAPTLLICGEHEAGDRKRSAEQLAALLPDAARRGIPGGGHLCNLCSPVSYNAALMGFIEHVRDNSRHIC